MTNRSQTRQIRFFVAVGVGLGDGAALLDAVLLDPVLDDGAAGLDALVLGCAGPVGWSGEELFVGEPLPRGCVLCGRAAGGVDAC